MKHVALAFVGGFIMVLPGWAEDQQDQGLPTYRVMPCPKECAHSTKAVRTSRPVPNFPTREQAVHGDYAEGLADIRYTIGTDGQVREAVVVQLMGPQAFADASVEAVKRWTFQPATMDGTPVEQMSGVRMLFRYPWVKEGARPEIASEYSSAMDRVREGKLDDAFAIIQHSEMRERLNFYERTMLAYAASIILSAQKNYIVAVQYVRIALLDDGTLLGPRFRKDAMRLGISLETRVGEFATALDLAEKLGALDHLAPGDDVSKTVAQIRAAIAAPNGIAVTGWIADHEGTAGWRHTLFRRTFGFDQIQGKLDTVQLGCDQQAIESPAQEGAEWHIPEKWSNCEGSCVRHARHDISLD